jgi:hypothetical protein
MRIKKYSGSSPHKTYAPTPNSIPAVVSFDTGCGPLAEGVAAVEPAAGEAPVGEVATDVAGIPSGIGTMSITAAT